VAEDETTDLTEDGEESAPAKGKKQKAPKAPKPPKAPKAPKAPKEPKAPKVKKEKKKKEKGDDEDKGGAGGIVIIMLLVLAILLGGFTAALIFDVFSAREIIADVITEPLLDVIIWLDPGFSSIRQRLAVEEEAQDRRLEERKLEMDEREADIEILEAAISSREQILERRGFDLDRREEQIVAMYERTIPLYRRDMTEDELDDMLQISRIYTQLAPEAAAERLVRLYDRRDVAAILYFMGERNAASILAEMEVGYAAEITEILLYN